MSDILSNGNIIANRANTARTEDTPVIPVQHIDATGTVGGVTLNTALDKTNDSITNYPVGCNYWVMDCSDNTDDAVSAGAPAILVGVYVSVAIATNPVVLYDGTTAIATLPTCAAGTYFQFPNVICATSLIANPADDTTGTITIFWRAL